MLLYAFCNFYHVIVQTDFEGMIGKIINFVDGDFLHSGLVSNISFFLGGEQVID